MSSKKERPKRAEYALRNRKFEFRSAWFLNHRPKSDNEMIKVRGRAFRLKQALIKQQRENKDLGMAAYGPAGAGAGAPWFNIGPRNINGRIKAIAVHPTDPNTVFAAAASGGVWRTTDGGESWYSLWHDEDTLVLGGIAIAPSNPMVIYAGTGEGVVPNTYGAAHNFPGVGIYKSTDGGTTWNLFDTNTNRRVTRVIVHPTDPDTVWVTGWDGIEVSTDGGSSWTMLQAGVVSDMVVDPTDTDVIYIGIDNDGIYKTPDGGATWPQLMAAPSGGLCRWPRLDIGNAANFDNLVLKVNIGGVGSGVRIFTSNDGGTTWPATAPSGVGNWMGWCDLVGMAQDDPQILIAGGVNLRRSDDGGTTWASVTGIHADLHRVAFAPSNTDIVYICDDGGVYRSDDKGATLRKVSHGLVVTQYYDLGSWDTISNVVGGGTQDQGTSVSTGGLTWKRILGADGGFVVFDPTDPRTIYAETQSTNIRKTTNGGASWGSATSGISGATQWVGVITMDPNDNQTLYTGTNRVFKTTNGATNWNPVSQVLPQLVHAIAVAPSNSNRVYAGTGHNYNEIGDGRVFRSDDGGATSPWTEFSTGLPTTRPVMDFAVDRGDDLRVFVAYGGTTGAAASSVFMSTTGGAAWTDISGNLPDISVSAIELDPNAPNTIYVGTDVGVFCTTDLGVTWIAFDNGIPHVPVNDLHIDVSEEFLYASTFGRGMYKVNIAPSATVNPVDLYLRDSVLDVGQLLPSPSGHPNPLDTTDTVHWWESPDIKADVSPYFTHVGSVFDGVEFDNDLQHEDPERTKVNRFYLQVHNRGHQTTTNVSVRAFLADASAGLPNLQAPLVPPAFAMPAGAWTPVGPAITIPTLEPNRPVIVSWDYTLPASAATHSCMLAVCSSADDPITTTQVNPGILVPSEKRVALKNLHVIDAGPTPGPFIIDLKFHKVLKDSRGFDIIINPDTMHDGTIGLILEKHEFISPKKAFADTTVYELAEGEKVGSWYRKFGHDQVSNARDRKRQLAAEKEIADREARLESQLDRSRIYDFLPDRKSGLLGIRHGESGIVRALLVVKGKRRVPVGEPQRFTIIQRENNQIVGGSTFEIRQRTAKAVRPVSCIRVTLERIKVLDDKDKGLLGKGEMSITACTSFDHNPNRKHFIRIPEEGEIKVSDKEGQNVIELNQVIYEGYVGIEDDMRVSLQISEHDCLKRKDELTAYDRLFPAPPETWVGYYTPDDSIERKDPENLGDWQVWYRIESLGL